jgi:putative ABC transport system ATP-binding protein
MNTALLEIQNLSLHFPGSDKQILENISYPIYPEDFVVILGSNGSGKSSLLKVIDKRYPLLTGEIILDEKKISAYSSLKFSQMVKTLTQNCNETLFGSLTVMENYLIVKQQHEAALFTLNKNDDKEYFAHYISKFNANLTAKLDTMVDLLSGGEKQALALGLMVIYPPRLLLLDEHTSALDPKSAEIIMQLTKEMIEKYKITCMMTTHDLVEAKNYGNRILALKNGKVHHMIEPSDKLGIVEEGLLEKCY